MSVRPSHHKQKPKIKNELFLQPTFKNSNKLPKKIIISVRIIEIIGNLRVVNNKIDNRRIKDLGLV